MYRSLVLLGISIAMAGAASALPVDDGTRLSPAALSGSVQDHGVDDATLLTGIDSEIRSLDVMTAMSEMQRFASETLEQGRVDLFRDVMVTSVDARWEGLSDPETALNMISWLPDTAGYLPARIDAAEIAIRAGALSDMETRRLWQGLQARVERVGTQDLMLDLAGAMARSGDADAVLETINRFDLTERARLSSLATLLSRCGADLSVEVRDRLVDEIDALVGKGVPPHTHQMLAEAYWSGGQPAEALRILALETDPLRRLRMKMNLLKRMPVAIFEPADGSPPEGKNLPEQGVPAIPAPVPGPGSAE